MQYAASLKSTFLYSFPLQEMLRSFNYCTVGLLQIVTNRLFDTLTLLTVHWDDLVRIPGRTQPGRALCDRRAIL